MKQSVLLLTFASLASAADYYAHPSGSGTACTFASPCTLADGIGASSPVSPGDTLWVMGQTCFSGLHTNALEGTSEAPIAIRAYPNQRACVDLQGASGYGFRIHTGAYTRWVGIEFLDSNPPRRNDVTHASGVEIQAPNAVLALAKIHDITGTGLAFWHPATNSSLVGNLLWGNGGWNVAQTRVYGHNLYTQHEDLGSTKYIHSTMWRHSMNTSWRLGGTEARVRYVNLDVRDGVYLSPDEQFDGATVRSGWAFANNHFIRPQFTESAWTVQINEVDQADSGDIVMTGNYFIGQQPFIQYWKDVTFTGNTFYAPTRMGDGTGNGRFWPAGGTSETFDSLVLTDNRWVKNCDSGAGCLKYGVYQGGVLTYTNATDGTDGLVVTRASLTAPEVIYDPRPGEWEQGRCHIVIYNWGGDSSADVNLTECGLQAGDWYEIHDLQDLNAGPVQRGGYNGSTVSINLTYAGVSQPVNGEAVVAAGASTPFAYARIDPLIWAGVVRRLYDGRNDTTLAWRGAVQDVIEAGYRKPDDSYTWGDLPVTQIACTDGRCRAKVPQAVGDAWWRINGGVPLKMAAR